MMAPGKDDDRGVVNTEDPCETPGMELEHAIGFSDLSGGLHYHPNGTHLVYAAGGTVVICDFKDPHKQHMLAGHDGMITCIALGSSGKYIASGQGGHNSDVIVWSFQERTLVFRLSEHDHGVAFVDFSHDDRLLLSGGVPEDRKILIWDMSNGCIVAIVQHDPVPTTVAAWGGMVRNIKRRETQNYLLATAGNKKIVLWSLDPYSGDISADRVVCEARGSLVRDMTALAFSEDGETLRCTTSSGDFVGVDLRSKQVGVAIPAARLGALSLLCHAGGTVIGGGDGTITLFDNACKDYAQTELRGGVVTMSFNPDRTEDDNQALNSIAHNTLETVAAEGVSQPYFILEMSPRSPELLDKYKIVAGTNQGRIHRVRMDTLASIVVSENHRGPVTCISYARGVSDRFATASVDGTVRVWDTADYGVLTTAVVRDAGEPLCLVLTQDMMLTGWRDGQIRSHDADTGQLLWSIDNAHARGVTSLVVSHNERFLVTGGLEGELRVWELRSRDLVSHLKQHGQRVTSLALFSDDVHALSVSRDRSLICWDLRSESQVSHHSQRMGGINAVALSQDETTVLTVGQEKRITYWDLREHHPVLAKDLSKTMDDEGLSLAVSHNGRFVATGGSAAVVKLWGYDAADLIFEGVGHSGAITGLRFSPDDKQLTSVGEDGNIFIWNIFG